MNIFQTKQDAITYVHKYIHPEIDLECIDEFEGKIFQAFANGKELSDGYTHKPLIYHYFLLTAWDVCELWIPPKPELSSCNDAEEQEVFNQCQMN